MSRWILVVEDEPSLGELICDNLHSQGYGSELIADGRSASARIQRGGIDLIILDIMLPGENGFSILKSMRDRGDETPVLVLSARSSDDDRIRGLELRADDYLTKPFNLHELLLRVDALIRRAGNNKAAVDPVVCEFEGNRIDFRSHMASTWSNQEVQLTPTEIKLMRMLSGRPGEVITRRELVEHLYGPGTPATHRSLDNMVLNLRRLFEHDNKNPKHLHTVRGVGIRFTKEQEDVG